MLTSRTPLRVSFFGGGTDYPEYFQHHPGAVLGTSIDKFIYISALRLEPFVGYGYRLSYRINEDIDRIADIQHPVFRAVFEDCQLEKGWNFGVLASLPSGSGLGSSSSFTVGLLKLLSHLRGDGITRYDLATQAIRIEREVLRENVGIQDHLHATFGGLNRYDFAGGRFTITPVRLHSQVRDALNASMYLVHTGIARHASQMVKEQIKSTSERKIDKPLARLYDLTREATALLEEADAGKVLAELGRMLDDGWQIKRSLSSAVSTPEIDAIHATVMANGALGGKLCGAGGGGFLLTLVPPERRAGVQAALGERALIPIRMDETGATVMAG